MHFENTKVLLLLWLVPLAAYWWHSAGRRRAEAINRLMSATMQRKLQPADSPLRGRIQQGLILAALALGIVAASRPQWGEREEIVSQRGRDVMILLDVSRSMLATDVRPSRLERAKTDLLDLIHDLRGDRAGLIAFRRRPIILCPLTTDYAFLTQMLDGAGIHSAPAGETDIGAAIRLALESFSPGNDSHRSMILISDGEDLGNEAVAAAGEAGKRGIPIFTIGLGATDGSRIPDEDAADAFVSYQGKPVVTKMNNQTLYAIADKTGGEYLPVGTSGMSRTTLGTLYRQHLGRVSARDNEEQRRKTRIERYQWFLLPAVLCLLAATTLSRGRLASARTAPAAAGPERNGLKRMTPPPVVVKKMAVVLLLTSTAFARAQTNAPAPAAPPPERSALDLARDAQAHFDARRYGEAEQQFRRAATASTGDRAPLYLYNAAASLHAAGKYKEAADLLEEISRSAPAGSDSYEEALGIAAYRAAHAPSTNGAAPDPADSAVQLRRAAEAFRMASRSGRENRAQNLSRLGTLLPELSRADEDARISRLMKEHGNTPPPSLLDLLLREERDVLAALAAASTNQGPSRIEEMESLASRQRNVADLWIPLKAGLLQARSASSDTNGPSPAEIEQYVEATRDRMQAAATRMEELDPAAQEDLQTAEAAVYNLWRGLAPYSAILREDLWRQSNAVDRITARRPDPATSARKPAEERQLTGMFRERFAQETAMQAAHPATAGDTNSPALSKEDRAKIDDLTQQAASQQAAAASALERGEHPQSAASQREAYRLLREIEKLLPKSKQQQQEDKSGQQQDSGNQQKQESGSGEKREQKPSEDQAGQKGEEQKQEQKQEPRDPSRTNMVSVASEEVANVLERALQREKQHELEKRRRDRNIPMSPSERDW